MGWGRICSPPVRDRRRSGHGPDRSAPNLNDSRTGDADRNVFVTAGKYSGRGEGVFQYISRRKGRER